MATITESQALAVVGLAHMKTELRIPATETSHDALLTRPDRFGSFLLCSINRRGTRRPSASGYRRRRPFPVRWQPGAWTACGRLRLACAVPIV